MKTDYLKRLSKGSLKNFKRAKPKNSTIRYYEDGVSFVLHSKIDDVDFGRFRCSFQYEPDRYGRVCRMDSLDYGWRDYPHPHIEGYDPCLGSYLPLMRDALECGEIDHLINLTQQFLNSYNNESLFVDIDYITDYLECGCYLECECD